MPDCSPVARSETCAGLNSDRSSSNQFPKSASASASCTNRCSGSRFIRQNPCQHPHPTNPSFTLRPVHICSRIITCRWASLSRLSDLQPADQIGSFPHVSTLTRHTARGDKHKRCRGGPPIVSVGYPTTLCAGWSMALCPLYRIPLRVSPCCRTPASVPHRAHVCTLDLVRLPSRVRHRNVDPYPQRGPQVRHRGHSARRHQSRLKLIRLPARSDTVRRRYPKW